MRKTKQLIALTAAVAASMSLSACDDGRGSASGGGSSDNPAKNETISIGVAAGWDEGVVMSNLAAVAMEDAGYKVELEEAEVGVIYTALSDGAYDLFLDGWLPITHEAYMKKYEDEIEDLGVWYDDARLALAVNNDSKAQSIADLKEMSQDFDNQIIGIDAGAGITSVTQNEAIPTYGLGLKLKTSSTAAMLAELDGAMKRGEDIVVTLWTPHWAYAKYDIRNLEDPEGAMGGAEEIHSFARLGFSEEYPEIAKTIGDFTITDEELSDLENYVINEHADSDPRQATRDWLAEHENIADSLVIEG